MAITANQASVGMVSPSAVPAAQHSYVDWAAILAGAVLASAISFVLLTFGSAIGLSLTSPYEGESMSLAWFAVAVTIWVLWVTVSSFMAGAYVTGRLRRRMHDATEHEVDVRDGAHGLLVWAVAVLIGALVAATGLAGAANTAAQTAGAAAAMSDDPDSAFDRLMDSMFRPEGARSAPADNESRGEVAAIISHAAMDGTLSDSDRTYAARVVGANANLNEAQAQARVDEMYAQAKTNVAEAKAAAEKARKIGVVIAFLTAASLLVSAAGAIFAAKKGGDHRDKGIAVAFLSARRR